LSLDASLFSHLDRANLRLFFFFSFFFFFPLEASLLSLFGRGNASAVPGPKVINQPQEDPLDYGEDGEEDPFKGSIVSGRDPRHRVY
jgi:hypothetical protein